MRVHTRLTYFKDLECNLTVRVSGGDLCAAEAPIEPAGETKDASKFGAQSEGRDLISGSLCISSCNRSFSEMTQQTMIHNSNRILLTAH